MNHVKKNFIRKKEDFTCEKCGTKVKGTGYTNYCPNCLWSKHVDKNVPGDRAEFCHGLMEPVGVELDHREYCLLHRCQKCGRTTKNKTEENDNVEIPTKLSPVGVPQHPPISSKPSY